MTVNFDEKLPDDMSEWCGRCDVTSGPSEDCPEHGAHQDATVHRLEDHRKFDVGTPRRCYKCGTSEGIVKHLGDGGYVWGCLNCGHPAD